MNITIIWWTSGFGKWLAENLMQNYKDKISLTITWTDENKCISISNNIGCKYNLNNINAVEMADVTIVSVPISITIDVINQIWPYLKKWSIICDVTSVKIWSAKVMDNLIKRWIFSIPMHPVFWPFVKNINWQVVVLTPQEDIKNIFQYKFLIWELNKFGAKVIECSPEKHDEMMSIIQWITHFSLFVMGETLRRLKVDMDFANNFVSPVYKLVTSTIARYMNQNPSLYADIQLNNDLNLKAHEVFIQTSQDFHNLLKNNQKQEFVDGLKQTANFFWNYAKKWQNYTDKIIYIMWKQLEYLKNNIGNTIVIENIYSKQIIKWILEYYDDEKIWIEWNEYNYDEWIVLYINK